MSIEAMKMALEALELEDMACRYEKDPTPEHIAKAITALRQAIEQAQQVDKEGSPCPQFWDWLPKAYNFEGDGVFTKYNMEVAFLAGKQAIEQAERSPLKPCRSPYCECDRGKCTHPGFYDARHEQAEQAQPVGEVLNERGEVDWISFVPSAGTHLYTATPQRQPLTSQERDAHRWRFLMENSYDSESVTQFHVWEHSWEPHSQTGEPTEWKQRIRGIALIDFIDRAIEAAHGIKEK